ncbi:MAG: hypothetical protein OEM15_06440 [Myxococcales bacterium]|nr:hypothetical protein [Myxococcales bacterium]MDH3484349.1 hypothetical protein [Myxococcales bacterium]
MRLLHWIGCTVGALVWIVVSGCDVYDSRLIEDSVAGPPPRPPAATSSPDDAETLVFALKDVYIEQSAENAARIGIDLDSVVTTGQDDASCQPRNVDGEVVGKAVVDGNKGIDNSLGTNLLPTVGAVLPCLQDNLALTQGRGIGTIVLWVRGWNGQPDDASVSAMLTTAVDGTTEDPSEVGYGRNSDVDLVYTRGAQTENAPDPGWDAEDWWYLDPEDFDEDETGEPSIELPNVAQTDAYVAFGRLVLPLPPDSGFKLIAGDGSLPSDGSMNVVVNGGFMMGDLTEDLKGLEHGLFTGRFTIEKLGEATPNIGVCAINATVIESLFGQYADIQSSPEMDGTGAECDAFSLGVTFSGVAGRIAGLAPASRPTLEPCADGFDVPPDRCCPSQWLEGRTREDTCDTPEKTLKADAFDRLPNAVQVPVPAPDFL